MKGYERPTYATRKYVMIVSTLWIVPTWYYSWRTGLIATIVFAFIMAKNSTFDIAPPKDRKQSKGRTTTIKIKRPRGM